MMVRYNDGPLLAAPTGPVTEDIPLIEGFPGGFAAFLAEIQPGGPRTVTVSVMPTYLGTYAYRTPETRIFEASLVIKPIG